MNKEETREFITEWLDIRQHADNQIARLCTRYAKDHKISYSGYKKLLREEFGLIV